MQSLIKHYRSRAAGVSDLLNWASLVDDGTVLCKDGSLLGGFFFRGPDLYSATAGDLNDLTRRVNAALLRFGKGWAMWVESVRLPTSAYSDRARSHFPDPLTRLIDEERRWFCENEGAFFETEYAIVLSYTPPLMHKNKFVDLMYENVDGELDAEPEGAADQALKLFKRQLGEFQDAVGDILRLRRMVSRVVVDDAGYSHLTDELVNFLKFTLTGEEGDIYVPDAPMYLDAYIGVQDLTNGFNPKFGNKYVACVGIEGFPSYSMPGLLNILDHLAIPYRWSTRFMFLDQQESLKPLEKEHRTWAQKSRGFFDQVFKTQSGRINIDAILMSREVDQAITDANSGLVAFGYYTPVIVLMGEDITEVQENAKTIAKEILKRGFATRVEEPNALDAWFGTLPGHTKPNVRKPLMHTLSLAHLLPLSSAWPGRIDSPCPFQGYAGAPALLQGSTIGSTPFRLNLHVDDLGHTLIFGPTGAGKSVLLNTIAAQAFRYQGMQVMAFDKGYSMLPLCLAAGGTHYDMAGTASPALCPLRDLDTAQDLASAAEWIESCYELQVGQPPSPTDKRAIFEALKALQNSAGRSLTDFKMFVQSDAVKDALQPYTLEGPYGHLLDAVTDDLALNRFAVVEIGELLALGPRISIPVIMLLSKRFESMLDGRPSLLIFDEAWVMLGDPVFSAKIREILKTYRKKNCAWVGATQSLSDVASSGIMDTLTEACPTKIFLPNPEATIEVYGPMGLNGREVEIIRTAERKRQYYYTSPDGRRLFSLVLGPVALSFVAVSDSSQITEVRGLYQEFEAAWPDAWLRKRKVDYTHLDWRNP